MIRWMAIGVFLSTTAFSQEIKIAPYSRVPVQIEGDFKLTLPEHEHQYLFTRWTKGILYYVNGSSKAYDSLNFDLYGGFMEVVVNNKPLSIFPMGLAGALIYNSPKSGFVLVVGAVEGEQKLLLVYSVGKYVLASLVQTSETFTVTTHKVDEVRFEPKPEDKLIVRTYYYIWDGMTWDQYKLNKSAISNLFNIDKKELQSIASKANINTQNKSGLASLFIHLNSIAD